MCLRPKCVGGGKPIVRRENKGMRDKKFGRTLSEISLGRRTFTTGSGRKSAVRRCKAIVLLGGKKTKAVGWTWEGKHDGGGDNKVRMLRFFRSLQDLGRKKKVLQQ